MADFLSRWFQPPPPFFSGVGASAINKAVTLAYWAGVKDGATFAAVALLVVLAVASLLRGKR